MQQTGLQSFLQRALWWDTWLLVKGNVSVSYQAYKFLLCFQLIFVYEWRNWSGENSYALSCTDIFIASKSYAGILTEYCVLAMQTVPQPHGLLAILTSSGKIETRFFSSWRQIQT